MPEGIRDAAQAGEAWAAGAGVLPEDPHRLPPPQAWFARDAERHLLDRPKYCPMCGHPLDVNGITTEYWTAGDRNFMTWCASCHWFGEVVRIGMVVITEAEH